MTALDQAFIKAFAQRTAASVRPDPVNADAVGVASSGSSGVAVRPTAPVAASAAAPKTLAPGASRLDIPRTSPLVSASRGSVLAELKRPRKPPATPLPNDDPPIGSAPRAEAGRSKAFCSRIKQPDAPDDLKPAWHVQSFTWPKICRCMVRRAGDQVRALAEVVTTARGDGRAAFAIAGRRRGEGATTLLLCVARQLAEQGVRAAIVDADRRRPTLARRLGVQPQIGWDAAGDACDQAIVEAGASRLALLPLEDASDASQPRGCDWTALGDCIGRLRSQYDVVLVDIGPVDGIDLSDGSAAHSFGRRDRRGVARSQPPPHVVRATERHGAPALRNRRRRGRCHREFCRVE